MSSSSWFTRAFTRAGRRVDSPKQRMRWNSPKISLERLEDRLAPAQTWVAQGPGPTASAQVRLPPTNEIAGAIESIAPHPTDPAIVYIGAVNGGVWKTTNATATLPTWTPLTDNLQSQSIGAIALDPTDTTGQTLLVGTGRFSSFGNEGDDLVGLYYTTNGGTSWTQFNTALLVNQSFAGVTVHGQTMLAASTNGRMLRSTDGGQTWANIAGLNGLGSGAFIDLVGDPGNPNRFYTGILGVGLYRTDDSGNSWTNITAGITLNRTTNDNIKFGVHNSTGNNVIYVGVDDGGSLSGVFRSTNQGSTWVAMDKPTVHNGFQGSIHFAVAAHPTNPNLVFISGDRIANGPFTGLIVRGDATLGAGNQFTTIVDGNAGNTSPHADGRALAFDATGNLLAASDGGIARRATPTNNTGTWSSVNGTLAISEIHDIAYNSISNTILTGTQDNGTQQQPTAGTTTWNMINGGDGGDVAVDNVSLSGSNQSIRYFSSQFLGGFVRQVIDANNNVVSTTGLASITGPQFVTPIEINTVSPLRLLIGGGGALYESLDQGSTNTNIAARGVNANAMVYGGRSGGVPNPDLIYIGSNNQVYARTTAGGSVTATSALPTGASFINDVAIDSNEWKTVFVIDSNQVFRSTDAGVTWTDITGNLLTVSSGQFQTIEFIPLAGNAFLTIGTRSGVFVAEQKDGFATWRKFGNGLPDVLVYDLEYDATDDVLVAGTLGRSAWMLIGVTATEDFGDAPDSYGTLLASNGARHTAKGLTLGATVDVEYDAGSPLDGTGDDVTDSNDEDGVAFGALIPGSIGKATVNVQGSSGFLNAWIDFDNNGTFDAGEQIATNVAVKVGDNTVTFAIPSGTSNGTHYTRFRLTSASVASPSPLGSLPDGEVEDHVAFFGYGNINENFDLVSAPSLPAGWRSTSAGPTKNAWVTSTTVTVNAPNAVFAPDLAASDSSLVSPYFLYNATANLLFFSNFYKTQSGFDGGVLELSLDDGPFVDILAAGGSFTGGGYNATIATNATTNPLATRSAWSGDSGGYILTSVVLPAAGYGLTARLRWRLGTDDSVSDTGWRIDDVRLLGVNVTLATGQLAFEDLTDRDDTLTVSRVGDNIRLTDPNNPVIGASGVTQVDLNTVEVAVSSVTNVLQLTAHGGTNQITLNLAGGLLPSGGAIFLGGTGNDTLLIQGGSSTSVVGPIAFDGGDGKDKLQVIGSAAFASLSFLGGTGDDMLVVDSNLTMPAGGPFSFDGGDGTDIVTLGSANVAQFNFAGGAGSDSLFSSGRVNATSFSFDGGAGSDVVTVTGGLGGNTFLFIGGDGNDSVNLGPSTVSTLLNYTGGDGIDKLIFTGTLTVPAGGQLLFDGGNGDDRAELLQANVSKYTFLGRDGKDVMSLKGTLNVPAGGSFTFDGGLGDDRMELGGITAAIGGKFDYIGGPDTDTVAAIGFAQHSWNVNVNTVTFDNQLTFSAIENVQGGEGQDTFLFRPGSRYVGTLDAGDGNDVLNLTALPATSVSLGTANAVDGFTVNILGATKGSVSNINRVLGGRSTTDAIIGLNVPSQWSLDSNGGNYTAANFGLSFTGVEVLLGGASSDNLSVNAGGPPAAVFDGGLGFDGVRVNGSTGNDSISIGSSSVTVNGRTISFQRSESLEVFGGNGNDTFDLAALSYAFTRLHIYGEAGADTFNTSPSQTTNIRIIGGNGPGIDTLVIRRGSTRFTGVVPAATARAGRFSFSGRQPIDFDEIEAIQGTKSQFLPTTF